MSHDEDINQESVLLIDPCKNNPEQFLGYDITGQIISIGNNLRGLATINICHLKRRRLRDRRLEKIKASIDLLRLIRKIKTINPVATNDAKQLLQDYLLDDKCEYAGVSRYVKNDPDAFGV